MANYTNNFNKELLLINEPVTFTQTGTNKKILLKLPTLKQFFQHNSLMYLMGLLEKDVKELGKLISNVNIKNHYEFFSLVLALGQKIKELSKIREALIEAFSIILPEFDVIGGLIKFKNEVFMSSELFKEMHSIILRSMGKEEPIVINEEDDEFTRREKEAAIRARKIKESARRKSQKQGDSDFEKIFVAILYEFPQYTFTDLFDMNLYTIYFLYENVGKIAKYQVSQIAAGNGLAKSHGYFTEKV